MTETPNAQAPMATLPGPSTASVVLWLGLAIIAAATLVALLVVVGPAGQKDMLGWLSSLLTLAAAGGATGAAVQARRALGVSHRTGESVERVQATVDQVQHQTNGALDARMGKMLDEALKRAGVTPPTESEPS